MIKVCEKKMGRSVLALLNEKVIIARLFFPLNVRKSPGACLWYSAS